MDRAPLHITVVEDIKPQRSLVVSLLRREGHHANGVESAEKLHDKHNLSSIDLLITDLNLPGESGLSLASRFRKTRPGAGIIMLTALDQPDDKVTGYAHGADVYLTKPVDPKELIAVVGALSRRLNETRILTNPEGPLILNPQQLTLQGSENIISISQNEARLLTGLAHAPDYLLNLQQIFELLQITQNSSAKSALEVRIVRLRKKIKEAGYNLPAIKNIRNRGYQLSMPLRTL